MKHNKEKKYYWTSTTIDNKSVVIAFYEDNPRKNEVDKGIVKVYYIGFAIGNNRKQVLNWMFNGKQYINNKITGTGNIKFLIWAKDQILEFENFIKSKYNIGKVKIFIGTSDDKRFQAYKKGLNKYGYKEEISYIKELVKVI